MTDISKANPEYEKSVRKRYRAERRFRAYGIIAIGLAAGFLVVLVSDIVGRGLPAFWSYKVDLTVVLDHKKIDPQQTGNPDVIRYGNFSTPVKKSLYALYPMLKGRHDKKALRKLISSGASDSLRNLILADPAKIDGSHKVALLLSDDGDALFKGDVTKIQVSDGVGNITPSALTGDVTLKFDDGSFQTAIEQIKQAVAHMGTQADKALARMSNVALAYQARLAQAQKTYEEITNKTSPQAVMAQSHIDKIIADLAGINATVARLQNKANDFKRRLATADNTGKLTSNLPSILVRLNGGVIRLKQIKNDSATGEVLLPLTALTPMGKWQSVLLATPEGERRLSDKAIALLQDMQSHDLIHGSFNWAFFTSGDSREPEQAGVLGGIIGSALMLFVTLSLSLPIGIGAAIYLEEFAPKNRLTEIIEVNINNLAAVPSIVFGLLGLAVFLNFFGMPRSAPLLGGSVLALMTLPTIIIAGRAALRAVPPSIREGALGVGASRQQAVFHHVLPLAMPGIMTGTIIGMAQALGETAPLLMIGMVAFIVDIPHGITDAATALPVQIYLWSDLPEAAFQSKTSAAIMVLLAFLLAMNASAVILRKRFEKRW